MSGANSNEILEAKEYLVTNGLGGYASSTYKFGNTRKYHGVLVVAESNLQRFNLVNRVLDYLEINKLKYPLSTTIYQNTIETFSNSEYLRSFRLNDFPEWSYHFFNPDIKLKKSLVQVIGKNKTIIRYEIDSKIPGKLICLPLLTWRNIHETRNSSGEQLFNFKVQGSSIFFEMAPGKYLKMSSNFLRIKNFQDIYYNFYYPHEADRGYPALEDLQSCCEFSDEFPAGFTVLEMEFSYESAINNFDEYVNLSTQKPESGRNQIAAAEQNQLIDYFAEYNKRQSLMHSKLPNFKASSLSSLGSLLIKQSEQFMVTHPSKGYPQIIAGYHWFSEWGRDTFISFPGLFLTRKRHLDAKNLLSAWRPLFKKGLIPNTTDNLSYNSLDAIFWYIIAVWLFYQQTGDWEFLKEIRFLKMLNEIWESFSMGSFRIKIDEYGFLFDGNSDQAFTWMDAKVKNIPVVTRSGRAVEIQALWFNYLEIVLRIIKIFEQNLETEKNYFNEIILTKDKLKIYFQQFFWLEKYQCLNDNFSLHKNQETQLRLTANQIFVIALPFNILDKPNAMKVLKFCEKNLLTDVGLYTIDPKDLSFHKFYSGDQNSRDQAYHQGTVWPFLLGFYLKAYLKINDNNVTAKAYVRRQLGRLFLKLQEYQLDYLPEVFEAATLKPKGCISQCWSASCILEILYLLKNY